MGPSEHDAHQFGNTFHVTVLDDLLNSSTVMYIIERTLQLYETVQKINNQCATRSLNFLDFPLSAFNEHASLIQCSDYHTINILDVDKFASVEEGKNKETLKRNLKSFNLNVDTVIGDGNCCFHSIELQLHKLFPFSTEELCDTDDSVKLKHMKYLKALNLLGCSPDNDALTLYTLFLQELKENIFQYQEWIGLPEEELFHEISYMSENGRFSCNLADMCAKVCCNVLGLW